MRFEPLQTVVLRRDLPEHGLREGDLWAVVQVYEPDGLEVEFVRASGRTEALLTLREVDVRAVADGDLIAVRKLDLSPRTTIPSSLLSGASLHLIEEER